MLKIDPLHRKEELMRAATKIVPLLLGLLTCCAAIPLAFGQAYPAKPIRIVMPFPAGGAGDATARALADRLTSKMAQSIILDPRPGGGTTISVQYVINQPPDGYTLVNLVNSAAIRSAMANAPFDVRKDLVGVVRWTKTPLYVAINPQTVPVTSIRELVAFAKANPGKVNIGTYGVGSLGHLAGELLAQTAGITVTHVNYNGSVGSLTALLRGDTHAAVDAFSSLSGHVGTGRLRLLSTTSGDRSPFTPDVPGMRESGFPNIDVYAYSLLAAPNGTPPDILAKLNVTVNEIIREPAFIAQLAKLGQQPGGGSVEATAEILRNEVALYHKIISDGKLQLD
ncbi:MAG TPA: tripartite tricarboxylate transporter substrate-binding protein [Candidatus Eisenbacteria bacterium]|nr:tripartite tricarboxylate transporter substrate-binding protein [Candidatus Eisenbacteria bacterium]